jgi:excisionase family DNA binding protein
MMPEIRKDTSKLRLRKMDILVPSPSQTEAIEALQSHLQLVAPSRRQTTTRFKLVGPKKTSIPVPESVMQVLETIMERMAKGNAFALVPLDMEITTQQAAALLNVSRQYLVRLLNQKEIPYSKVGTHRRIKTEDLLAYKQKRDQLRKKGLDELSALSQEYGGYPEFDS